MGCAAGLRDTLFGGVAKIVEVLIVEYPGAQPGVVLLAATWLAGVAWAAGAD